MTVETPAPVHSTYPDIVAEPRHRVLTARIAAAAMAVLAALGFAGAALPFLRGMHDPVPAWAASAAFLLLALVASAAAAMELARARRAETVMSVAVMLGVLMTWSAMTNGWFIFAPLLVGATLLAILTLAHRAMARDELRHVSRDDTHSEHAGPAPHRAGPERTATQSGSRVAFRRRRGGET